MFDDETYGYFGFPTTVTEDEVTTEQKVSEDMSSQSSYETNIIDDSIYDDYSVTPNYSEEQSYNSATTSAEELDSAEILPSYYNISLPTIQKEAEPEEEYVSLVKTRQKITLAPRMKIVVSAFSIIMFALVFLIIFNYASLGGLRATIADRQATVVELQASISELNQSYNLIDNSEALKDRAENAGYVEKDESNTYYVSLGEFYSEDTIEKLPSNWFNDVCEFFSRLFG